MSSAPKKAFKQPGPAHEAICRKCGKCCRKKVLIEGRVLYLPYYCKYLDRETMLCTVYERRFEMNPTCKTIPEAIKLGILPADCAYVDGIADYNAPLEDWDAPEANEVLERLAEDYRSSNNLTEEPT